MEKAGELGNGLYLIGIVSRLCITDWDNAGRRCISFAELPKLDVAGSTPVARSKILPQNQKLLSDGFGPFFAENPKSAQNVPTAKVR